MGFDDWLLAAHLLAAFAFVSALVLFSAAIVALRRSDQPEQIVGVGRVFKVGTVVVVVGSLGVVIFGVWLAIALDSVQVWDGWVIAAIILWAIATETGRRAGAEYDSCLKRANELVAAGQAGADAQLQELAQTSRGLWLHTTASVLALLLLVDMIWKPGA